ncbi:MAG: glycosyltransferase family 2 protein [Acidobacteriota bacterium]|nr:glycosyltransferase family 2 protein [Acidobacteriota bacterium]
MARPAFVQILMAVYNGEEYLHEQIDSIRRQTHQDWELLVSDDCSTDGSLAILREYERYDQRIRVVLDGERHGSAKGHFMALLRMADAPYVMTCDQDDIWDEDKIEFTLRAMRDHERVEQGKPLLVCTDLRVVDEQLTLLSPSFLTYSGMDASKLTMGFFLASCVVTGCTMMLNASATDLCKVPVNEGALIMHDWWASLVVAAFGTVIHLDRATLSYRQHASNSVGADRFTVVRALASLDQKRQTARQTFAQAREFKRVFDGRLDLGQRDQVDTYLSLQDALPLARMVGLGRCDAWKHGLLRNLGHALVFLTL